MNMALVESSSRKTVTREELGPDLISLLPNDVLLQIFLRLPHVRSVIRCSAVCKRWSSLISNLPDTFIRRFIQYHKGEMSYFDSSPYTILLFVFDDKLFYQLFSEGSKILHRRLNGWSDSSRYLDFLPWPHVHVLASFDDLLLVTHSIYDPRPLQYCICNSLTRRWLILPREACPVSHHPTIIHGLACKSNHYSNDNHEDDDNNNNIRYKVVRLDSDSDSISATNAGYIGPLAIFCSESGKWSQSTLFAPSALAPRSTRLSKPIGTSNGMLHFPLISDWERIDDQSFTGSVLAFDPFDDTNTVDPKRGIFVDVPAGFSPFVSSSFGVVKGHLRLSQCDWSHMRDYTLKIWELNYENQNNSNNGPSAASWLLLYDGRLKIPFLRRISVVSFEPDNGGVVFLMSRSGGIYKYKIEEEKYEQVGEIPYGSLSKGVEEHYSNYMRSFTLVHPIWPTSIL